MKKIIVYIILTLCLIGIYECISQLQRQVNELEKVIEQKDKRIKEQAKIIDEYWWILYYNNASEYKGEYEYYE